MRARTSRLRAQRGFSFIELLIVVILLGILAAIVLPAFLSQTSQGDDASAKSNATEMARAVETCSTEGNDYTQCDEPAELQISGLTWGPAEGEVQVTASATRTYEVQAKAQGGHRYTWTKQPNGLVTRTCAPVDKGGCTSSGSW